MPQLPVAPVLRVAALAALTLGLADGSPSGEVRVLMGTTAEVRALGLEDPRPALDDAFAALRSVDDSMSLWKESELTALNRSGAGPVSAPLFIPIIWCKLLKLSRF